MYRLVCLFVACSLAQPCTLIHNEITTLLKTQSIYIALKEKGRRQKSKYELLQESTLVSVLLAGPQLGTVPGPQQLVLWGGAVRGQ